ncbi:MAG: histidinol dehydrogenase [Endomicrobium sp.]|uniref:histidinol dehydrogenase n=1 Tax=Candidatus Endomicrobiellum pyrsonymphae TaxID=1408203 RepID=UPI00357CB7E0|nr:histidinol dehydrogenase [Endomicrobium sp.]
MLLNRDLSTIKKRRQGINVKVEQTVKAILDGVRENGDKAVKAYAEKFEGFVGYSFEIENTVKENADFVRILERAKMQIIEFHKNQIEKSWSMSKDNGVIMGQIVRPLKRVAVYVPGGTANYPSSVLMNVIPAKLAGVSEIIMLCPNPNDEVLMAAKVAGVDKIYKIGGAQAIAAVAYGTESIPKVDKIVGPGNIYVAMAKKQVYGEVDIDMIAGPSEVLVIADKTASPKYIAADLMSQAEHDKLARAILITTSEKILIDTEKELERQFSYLERREIIEDALRNYGAGIVVDNLEKAFELSNEIAPEHLEILTENPLGKLPKVKNAGSIFLGENTPESLGDYMSGANHVLPTGGTAKFCSSLGVYDFVKVSSYSYYPREILANFKDDVIKFAKLEGLDAHVNSIKVRFEVSSDD